MASDIFFPFCSATLASERADNYEMIPQTGTLKQFAIRKIGKIADPKLYIKSKGFDNESKGKPVDMWSRWVVRKAWREDEEKGKLFFFRLL